MTGPETLAAPLLGLVPDVAALGWSEKTLNTPTDRSDRSNGLIVIILDYQARLGEGERGRGILYPDNRTGHRRMTRSKREYCVTSRCDRGQGRCVAQRKDEDRFSGQESYFSLSGSEVGYKISRQKYIQGEIDIGTKYFICR